MKISHVRTAVWLVGGIAIGFFLLGMILEEGYVGPKLVALLAVAVVTGGIDYLMAWYAAAEKESELEEHPKAPLGQNGNGVE